MSDVQVRASVGGTSEFGGLLRSHRRERGLTQEELAERSGLSVRAISDLERGRAGGAQRRSALALAQGLELTGEGLNAFIEAARAGRRRSFADAAEASREASSGGAPSAEGFVTDGVADAHRPAQLPADLSDFTGRAEQVKDACDRLSAADDLDGAPPIVLVAGAGGIGKTAFAIRVAHRLRERFVDGQLYVNLQGAGPDPVQPGEVLGRFLRALGAEEQSIPDQADERAALFRSTLADRRVLVVLDDARDIAQITPLLPGGGACAVLVTSRTRHALPPGGGLLALDALAGEDARRLLCWIVGAQRVEAEPDAAEILLECCAGLPLAIRIAGSRLAMRTAWSIAAMTARLADEKQRLDALSIGDSAVRTCFQASYASLPSSDDAHRLDPAGAFRLLGLWDGPDLSLPGAAALLGRSETDAEDVLEFLVDAHLLESPSPGRYRLHDLLRIYAAERAEDEETEGDRRAALDRILMWYLHTAHAMHNVATRGRRAPSLEAPPLPCRPLAFDSPAQALDWCEVERANLVAATRHADAVGDHATAWQLPVMLRIFYETRRHLDDWNATYELALIAAQQAGDQGGQAWILNSLAAYNMLRRRFDDALDCSRRAQSLAHSIGDRHNEAAALTNQGVAYDMQGRFDDAIPYFRQSLVPYREIGNRLGEASVLTNLAIAYNSCRPARLEDALECGKLAVAACRELGNRPVMSQCLCNLSDTYVRLERFDEALQCLDEALPIFQEHGDRYGESVVSCSAALCHVGLGHDAEAVDACELAAAILRELDEPCEEAEVYEEFGQACHGAGRIDAAASYWQRALAIYEELGEESRVAAVRQRLDGSDS